MPLSRLENFLKNVDGNILYVNPTDLDATDSIENQGNSLTRPFKTIQRALLEASRFSYQVGENNDKFDRTTVLLYPGVHEVDNRPGYGVTSHNNNAVYTDRLGNVKTLDQLSETSNYNIDDPANELYKYNSVEGGVIVPRGVSLAGYDVRKTKIRPKFVPDPENLAVTRGALFRLTGGCHFWAVSFFDGNPQGSVYKDYTTNRFSPHFSHHKLTVFEYADGVNGVGIGVSSPTTDLSMYFHKIQKAFGDSSGRAIGDFPATTDMQPTLPEYEMVGPVKANDIGISSIRAGTGGTPDQTILVTTGTTAHGLVVDSPIRIAGINTYPDIYNGNFVVSEVVNDTSFKYLASAVPADGNAWATIDGDEVVVADTDNVTGSSPYIFHCSMRSAYGMCGLHADGSKASGFKSMLVSQFTGISLQKDNNALLIYNKASGAYDTNATAANSEKPLYLNGSSVYRPSYKNTHIKVSNDGYIQAVSIFAVGFNEHFTSSDGGDLSITNSNSNFGAVALNAKGFKPAAFNKDNRGYITHIIPPESQFKKNISIEWESINVNKTVGVSSNSNQIFLDGFTDESTPPTHVIAGYRIGANTDDLLHVSIGNNTYSAQIRMQNPGGTDGSISSKEYEVNRTGLINSIANSVLTLRSAHKLFAGESIRVVSDDGFLPDGLSPNTIYYAITNASTNETLNNNQIKLARSKNDALLGGSGNFITINNNKGGILTVSSRVSDKAPGDLAHPIQWLNSKSNWYVNVTAGGGAGGGNNALFTAVAANSGLLGQRTGKSFIKRKEDTRPLNDKIYRLRYVIPKESLDARPPIPGYTLQESNTVGVDGATEFTNNIPDVTAQRNLRILKSINRDSNTGITTVVTEKPHHLVVGDAVQLRNVKSSGNSPGDLHKGFNVVIDVVGISSSKGFEVDFGTTDPGSHVAHVGRDENLPVVARWSHKDTFTVYRSETIKAHDYQRQDGVYHLICIDSSISPTVNEFGSNKFNQNITDLYPQFDADNFTMDPQHASSFAVNNPVGKVVTSDLRHSLTKEFSNNFIVGNRVGYAITYAEGSTSGITTIYTNTQHNLNTILAFNATIGGSGGSGYNGGSAGTEYNIHCTGGSGQGATVNATVNGSGAVTAVEIADGGSGYTVGNTLTLRSGNNGATIVITKINDNIGDAIQIIGVGTDRNRYNSGFNGIHTVTAVTPTTVSYNNNYVTSSGIHSATTAGIHTGFFMLAGNAPNINAIAYDAAVGIVTVTTDEPHGLSVNNTINIVGSAQTIYNGQHLVYEKNSTTQFSFRFDETYTAATYTTSGGKAQVLPVLYGAKGGIIEEGNERIDQRQIPLGVGIHTTLSNAAWVATNTTLTLTSSNGFNKGDYVQVDSEIIRISSAFSSNVATVLRGQLGSRAEDHVAGSVVKKIRILAVEKRRASVLRASGHTFEYLGYGPGNYSTSFPEKQDKILTREENFLAQSMIDNGGSVVYTGVNDAGDFHIGNKVVNSQDGTESTFNIPVPTTTGSGSAADSDSGRLDVIFDSAFVREGLTVDGNNNTTVRINAPTTITEKLTVTSDKGAEFHSIDLTGGLSPSRTITYVESAPTGSGTVGDIVYKANPSFGDHIGWTYTPQGWKRYGLISTAQDADTWVIGDTNNNGRLGIGTTAADRAGVNANFRGALDVRGQVVADKLLMTGISTFLGTTIFADVTIGRLAVTGNLDVTGVTTFSKFVTVGAGLTANELHVTGISTFNGAGAQIVMQHKPDKTATAANVNHGASPAIITITNHGYTSGEKVQYVAGTTAIGGLTNHRAYYIIRQSSNTFSLATTAANAAGGTSINLSSAGVGTHTFQLLDRSADAGAASDTTGVSLTVDKLNIVGIATFPSNLNLTDVNIASMAVSGLSTFNGTSDFNGSAEFANPVTLNSTLNANADVNLGNATSDTITATGRFDSALVPSTDNARDLGASSLEWKDLYLDGTANIDSLIADTAKVSDLTNNRIVIAGASGELEDSGNLTFNGSTLGLTGGFLHTGNTTHDGDVQFTGANYNCTWDKSENELRLSDNAKLTLGTNGDADIKHNNTDFRIENSKGHIYIQNSSSNDDSNIYIQAKDGEHSIVCEDDANVWLYYNGKKRLVTTDAGITVYEGGAGSETSTGVITGSGAGLIELNASNISSGTISASRLPSSMGGNSASSSTVAISQSSSNTNHQVLFVAVDASGNHTPLIDNNNGDFLYNPNTSALSGLAAVTATTFNGNIAAGTITATGTVNLNGHVNIGNATSDLVSITAAVDSNLHPDSTSNNRDLGNSVQKWRNVYGVNFYGSGANLTSLNASQLSSGTVNVARLGSGTANGSKYLAGDNQWKTIDLTQLNASNLTSGTVAVARLGSSGTRNGSNFLAGDNEWKSVPPSVTVSNNASNRVITGEGGNALNGESNLTWDNSELRIHGSGRVVRCDGNIIAYNGSDITLKDNIQPITNAVEKVLSISGNTFTWNDKAPQAMVDVVGKEDTGVIAQEIEKLELPGTVQTKDDGTLGVRYDRLVPLLIEAIKELKGEIDELKSQIK